MVPQVVRDSRAIADGVGMTFSLRARHGGRVSHLSQGDELSLEFKDGKGVSGRIADVDVEPGGASFVIIVTHDGQPLTGDAPDIHPQLMRDMIAAVQDAGYVVQEKDDYEAGLRIEYERGRADAASETRQDAVSGDGEGNVRCEGHAALCDRLERQADTIRMAQELETSLRHDLGEARNEIERLTIALDFKSERLGEMVQAGLRARTNLKDAEQARDYWRRKAHSRLMGVDTIVVNITNPRSEG